MHIYSFVGDAPPTDPRDYRFEGANRAKTEILFPNSVPSGARCGSALLGQRAWRTRHGQHADQFHDSGWGSFCVGGVGSPHVGGIDRGVDKTQDVQFALVSLRVRELSVTNGEKMLSKLFPYVVCKRAEKLISIGSIP